MSLSHTTAELHPIQLMYHCVHTYMWTYRDSTHSLYVHGCIICRECANKATSSTSEIETAIKNLPCKVYANLSIKWPECNEWANVCPYKLR